uniref:MORN repeat-containing protein 5 n=1 Tax=Falco tinnunculus TaxID=100819 RepID=A0A8C4UQX1_FALTI
MEALGGRYCGGIVRGRMEGQGSYTLPTGTEYRGALRDGMFDGEGELLFPNGGRYRAVWHRGVPTCTTHSLHSPNALFWQRQC